MMDDNEVRPVVLLVDDNKELRDMARTFFECHGYRTDSASTLKTALNVFHQYPNDLMVGFIDINMQGSNDGFDIIRYGRDVMPHRVVLYGWTGQGDIATKRKIADAGGHGTFVKGVSQEEFEEMEICAAYPNALKLVQRGSRDSLTNLKNRQAFEEDVLLEMAEMKDHKSHEMLYVIEFDMRLFKEINDEYGHLVGDRCLKHVADVIKSHVRGKDHPCRYGGDEFLICMAGVSRERVMETAATVQQVLVENPVEIREGIKIPLHLDWGIAELPRENISYPLEPLFEELMNIADARMYEAKKAAKEGREIER